MPRPEQIEYLDQEVRAAVAEIWRRVTVWRDSPGWADTQHNRDRYDQTTAAVTTVDQSPRLTYQLSPRPYNQS